MMPLSPQLQQHWQTVADRLPTDFPVAELSPQARSVMAFSDFVEQGVIAQPGWLNELADSAPAAEEWRHYEAWLQERLQAVTDEAGLMRELRLFRRQMMVRIAWAQALSSAPRRLSPWSPAATVSRAVSTPSPCAACWH